MQTARYADQNGSDRSACSIYSHDKYTTPARMRTMTAEMAVIHVASAERMGFGDVYDKHKDAILLLAVCKPQRRVNASYYRKKVNLCAILSTFLFLGRLTVWSCSGDSFFFCNILCTSLRMALDTKK